MRVLIIKLGAIGDICQMLTAIQAARMESPTSKYDLVTSRSLVEYVKQYDLFEQIFPVDEGKLFKGSFFKRLTKVISVNLSLSFRKYDRVVIPYFDKRYKVLKISDFLSSEMFNSEDLFSGEFAALNRTSTYYKLICRSELSEAKFKSAFMELAEKAQKRFGGSFKNFSGRSDNDILVAIIPGGAANIVSEETLRRWPIEHYVAIARGLVNKGYSVYLLGGANDRWASPFFAPLDLIDLIGKTSVLELQSLLSRMNYVLSHDTGPLHLSMLTQAKVISLFGPTPSSAIVPPFRSNTVILRGNAECSPCYDGRKYADCDNNFCMSSISPETVLAEFEEV